MSRFTQADLERRVESAGCTYSRGFFFGPGLPRGFGVPSDVNAMFRLKPGAGPFRFLGGSVDVLVALSGADAGAGAGVELGSEGASADSVTFSVGAPLVAGGGEGASEVCDDSSCLGCGFSSNCASRSGGSRSTTTLAGFLVLSDLLMDVDGDVVSAIVLDMVVWVVVDEV